MCLLFNGRLGIHPEQLKSTELCKSPIYEHGKNHRKRTSYIVFQKANCGLGGEGALVPFSSKVRKDQ